MQCLINQIMERLPGKLWTIWLYGSIAVAIAGILALLALIFPPASPFAWTFLFFALVIALSAIIGINMFFLVLESLMACAIPGLVPPPDNPLTFGLTAEVNDCPSAQAALEQALRALAAAERALRDQEERVRRARRRLRDAEAAAAAAAFVVAVAAAIPFGWLLLAAAIAALAVALGVVASRSTDLGRQAGLLQPLADALAAIQAMVAAMEEAVARLCPVDSSGKGGGRLIDGTRPVTTVRAAYVAF